MAVLAVTAEGPILLLGPAELDACEASPDRLVAAIERTAEQIGLAWTAAGGPESIANP